MVNKKGLLAALIGAGCVATAAQAQVRDYEWFGFIPLEDGTGVFEFASIFVDDSALIADIDVGMTIETTWQGDLIVELEHVNSGTRLPLIYRPGDSDGTGAGFSADNFGTFGVFRFDDEADEFYDSFPPDGIGAIPDPGIPDVGGSWIPYGSQASGLTHTLSAFDGLNKQGEWRLYASDNAAGDLAFLTHFSMTITQVPGPSALALLGVAGLVGRRRRR